MKIHKKIQEIFLGFSIYLLLSLSLFGQELVIGEERIEPGIVLIFEGAIKDMIMPESNNLSIDQTNVHIEARVNWDSNNIPAGTPANGFVPFLKISSIITNQKTALKTFIDLTPHINLIDKFGKDLFSMNSFIYKNVDFEEIARANRN